MGESANEDSCSKPLSKSQESEGLKQQKQWDDEDNRMSWDIVRIPWWNMGETTLNFPSVLSNMAGDWKSTN